MADGGATVILLKEKSLTELLVCRAHDQSTPISQFADDTALGVESEEKISTKSRK